MILKLWEFLEPVFISLGAAVLVYYDIMIGVLNGIVQALGPFIQAIISAVQFIIDILGAVISLITGDFDGAWEHVKSACQSFLDFFIHLWETILNYVKGFIEGITGFFLNFGVDLNAIVENIGNSVADFFTNMLKGITGFCTNIYNSVTGVFNNIKTFILNLTAEAFNWGKNLMISLGDGIKAAADSVINGVRDIGKSISDFLGFSSPTKKGEGRFADEWMPNLMGMMRKGINKGLPDIESSVGLTADIFGKLSNADMTSQKDDASLLNSFLGAMSSMNNIAQNDNQPIVLSIDGQVFARLILPSLNKEFKRNGIKLSGVLI